MTAIWNLTLVELRLLARDLAGFLVPIAIPCFVLLIFGLSFDVTDGTLPATTVAIALALNGLYSIPAAVGTYRENGVLRRLSATPVHPASLLVAQLLIHVLLTACSVLLLLVIATTLLDIPLPRSGGGTLAAFALGIVAMFAIGGLIAALAPSARAASGIGVLLYFPLAFLGGITIPADQMPPMLATIGAWTPLGAFQRALVSTWQGSALPLVEMGIMALYAIVAGCIAARCFRWH